jgi:hypothetical protein
MRAGGLGKFGLRAEFERTGSAEAHGHLAAHALGECPLTFGIAARVEAAHRTGRRGGADKAA